MKVSRGGAQDYLGMNITITKDKFLEIEMKVQIKDVITSFEESITGMITSPTSKHLFEINNECPLLEESKADLFHSVTAKVLYLKRHACLDIETAVAFLTSVPE